MRMMSRLLGGTALALIGTQTLALTGEEVWANQTGFLAANGVVISQTQTRADNVLTVSGISYDVEFPFGVGSLTVKTGSQTFTENADGTVSIGYGDNNTVAFAATFRPDDSTEIYVAGNMEVALTAHTSVASGTPADMTYVSHFDLYELTLADLTISGMPDAGGFDVDIYLSIADTDTTTQITTGAVTTLRSTSVSGTTITDYSFGVDEEFLTKSVTQQIGSEFSTSMTLPAAPMDLMNISQALRDGLAFELTANSTASQSQSVTMAYGEMMSNQMTTLGAINQTGRFDASGLSGSGNATDIGVDIPVMVELPFPINVTMGSVDYSFAFPVNAAAAPVTAGYAFALNDVLLNDEIWDMFDPARALPRDPVSIKADIAGTAVILNDLLDIEGLTKIIDAGGMPVDVRSVTINELSASGLGASATGSGDFTLDMSDLITFDGFPRPTGQATGTLTGVNGLLDKLISAGLMTADDAMAGRLMMGMFARVVGEDQLTSTLEITPEGHVIANGQRIQ